MIQTVVRNRIGSDFSSLPLPYDDRRPRNSNGNSGYDDVDNDDDVLAAVKSQETRDFIDTSCVGADPRIDLYG